MPQTERQTERQTENQTDRQRLSERQPQTNQSEKERVENKGWVTMGVSNGFGAQVDC